MSQFDFPRIHFIGKASVDPATGNNNYHFPLVTYDPLHAEVILPPRIYLRKKAEIEFAESVFPNRKELINYDSHYNCFLQISAIDTPDKFKSWSVTPLGKSPYDKAFHRFYDHINTENDQSSLTGKCPGYWNYYGTMNFELIDVICSQIIILEEGKKKKIRERNPDQPISELIGAKLSFKDSAGKNKAVMIDVSPTLSLFSQVFADKLSIHLDDELIFMANPSKSNLRQMNPGRVINDSSITGASGIFQASVLLDEIEMDKNGLLSIMEPYCNDKQIKGFAIRFDLREVCEDQNPDYSKMGTNANPAYVRFDAIISPLFSNESSSVTACRQLLPVDPGSHDKKLGVSFLRVDEENGLIQWDLVGSIPQKVSNSKFERKFVSLREDRLELRFLPDKEPAKTIWKGSLGPGQESLDPLEEGGILDIPVNQFPLELAAGFREGSFRLIQIKQDKEKVLLSESDFYIASEQAGVYSDQDDFPDLKYLSNSSSREACTINLYFRGKAWKKEIPVLIPSIRAGDIREKERRYFSDLVETIKHDSIIPLPTNEAGHFFYCFIPSEEMIVPHDIKHYMLISGAYINHRVLPGYGISENLLAAEEQISFELLYREFLMHYDLVYPASGIITPFRSAYFQKIKKFLRHFMSEKSWDKYLYMPSSRDMQKGKRALLFRWLEQQKDLPNNSTDKA
jgi:hypothetical protein